MLARSKKGKTAEERLNELYSGSLFVLLQKIDPDYMKRVKVIEGNTRELNVGLSEEIRNEVLNNGKASLWSYSKLCAIRRSSKLRTAKVVGNNMGFYPYSEYYFACCCRCSIR